MKRKRKITTKDKEFRDIWRQFEDRGYNPLTELILISQKKETEDAVRITIAKELMKYSYAQLKSIEMISNKEDEKYLIINNIA